MRLLPILMTLTLLPLAAQKTSKPKAKAKPRPAATAPSKPEASKPAPAPAPTVKPRVRLDTSLGAIVVELEPQLAPRTVENFLAYVRAGHYTNTIFHRVIHGFMIQGGGFQEDLIEKPTRPSVVNEAPQTFRSGLKNTRGTLAMARTPDPHSASSQFYINTVDNPALDFRSETPEGYGYCAFGRVVEGMDVVQKIERVRTGWRRGMQDVPEVAVRVKRADVLP